MLTLCGALLSPVDHSSHPLPAPSFPVTLLKFMMPPQPTSTMVLIIPLILNTLSAPGPQVRAPKENAPEIVYQIVDQPHVDLSSGSSPGHLPWLPPVDICSRHFGFGNNTDSSILLLLLVSLPGRGDQLARSHGSYMEVNHTIPWTSLPLEPGIYGVPRSGEESVCSYPFGLNMSLDVGLFSLCDSSLFPPMVGIEERPISDHRVGVPAAFFGVALCRGDGNGSFMESFFRDGRRYTTRELSGYKESVSSAQPRKLLGAHSRNLHNLHRQVLVRKERVVTAAAIAAGSAVLALLCTVAGLLLWCRWKMSDDDERPILQADLFLSGPRRYHYSELAAATNGFSEEGKIGRGGFGPVYRGYLSDQECHVAIKVLSQGSSVQAQGMREFQAEVKIMTRLRHRNIVELLGWCYGSQGLLLVYEFVPNGSLDKHLYDPHRLLSWSDRYKIALDVGSAILYLHTECQQCVLHGDIKPANILLDTSCNAKLGDFGLARLVDHETNSQTTQVVAGTLGYIDPEFVNSQRPSAESDVYSFGVVLLEISCGRRPTSAQSNQTPVLLNWVRRMYSENSILGAADRRLDGEFDDQQMRRVLVGGLWCTHHDQNQRPSIAQAMELLRRQDAELPILPSMHSHGSVRSMEEIAYGDLSAEESPFENSPADTAYHTSKDSTCLLEC